MPTALAAIIPAKTGVPTSCRLICADAAGDDQRINSENESTRGHHHSTKPHLRAEHSSFLDVPALLALVLSEFDDQYPVLRRHRDKHHEPNLGVKIEREMENQNTEKRAQNADRHRQQYRKWDDPALVKAHQNQEGKQDCESQTMPNTETRTRRRTIAA